MADRNFARSQVWSWVNDELATYADAQKWDRDDPNHTTWDTDNAQWWDDFVMQYLHRAKILGFDTLLGKQALLKALVTLSEMCVTMVVAGAELPPSGRPSGDVSAAVDK